MTTCTLKSRLHILSTLKTLKVATVLTVSLSMQTSLPGANNLWPPIGLFSLVEVQSWRLRSVAFSSWLDAPKQLWNAERFKDFFEVWTRSVANSNSSKIATVTWVHLDLQKRRLPEWKVPGFHYAITPFPPSFSIGAFWDCCWFVTNELLPSAVC